jgi:hypothetical protein
MCFNHKQLYDEKRMKEMLSIDLFEKTLGSEQSESSIFEALKKLTDVNKSEAIKEHAKGPKPLGSWTGWSF